MLVIRPPAALAANLSASSTTTTVGEGVTMTLELVNSAGGAAADVTAVTGSAWAPSQTDWESLGGQFE